MGQALRFEGGPIKPEVSLVVERPDEAGGRARIWVVDPDGRHTCNTTGTQRTTLSLPPRLAAGVGSPYVSGSAAAGER